MPNAKVVGKSGQKRKLKDEQLWNAQDKQRGHLTSIHVFFLQQNNGADPHQ
jgi:hypothetical protein